MGKGEASQAQSAAQSQAKTAQRSMDIGEQLLKAAAPARTTAQQTYMDIATGTPGQLQRAVAPSINAATQQFYMARRSAEGLPPGGARDQALRDVRLQEAASKSQIYSGGVNESLARLASMGWGGTQAGVGAFGQAGTQFGGASESLTRLSQMKAAGWQSLASGIGGVAGSK